MSWFMARVRSIASRKRRNDWLRSEPEPLWVPSRVFGRYLPKGTRLTRIYDRDAASDPRRGYSSLDYNPVPIHPDRSRNRGRFSATREVRPTGENNYAYMYVADGKNGLRTAIWETISFHGIRRSTTEYLLPSRIFKGRAIRYMDTTRRLYVVNVRDQNDCWPLKADITAIQGSNHRVTRAWAHYIRRVIPHVEGLRYRSYKDGKGDALVLFERLPHVTARTAHARGRSVRAVGNPISLENKLGKDLVRKAMLPTVVRIQ